ncbi:MAG: transposase [Verrucomicrobiaceae bacterium]|nr:transposase [Verrucomicrobiaceae bacterium]
MSILREARGGTLKVRDACALHNISEQTCHGWRRKHGGMQVDELRQARALAEEPSAATAKRAAQAHRGGLDGADRHLEGHQRKKMVSPASKRHAARYAMPSVPGRAAQVCRALELARSGYYRVAKVSAEARHRRDRIVRLSREHPRHGCRRIAELLRRESGQVSIQCVAHVAWSIRAADVPGVLESAMRKHGTPEHIRSDNGPEIIAYAIPLGNMKETGGR